MVRSWMPIAPDQCSSTGTSANSGKAVFKASRPFKPMVGSTVAPSTRSRSKCEVSSLRQRVGRRHAFRASSLKVSLTLENSAWMAGRNLPKSRNASGVSGAC